MTELDQLFAAIVANPDCDTLRLAYADRLDENGDHDRARFVRAGLSAAREPWCKTPARENNCNELGMTQGEWCDWCVHYEYPRLFPEWSRVPCPACPPEGKRHVTCSICGGTGDLLKRPTPSNANFATEPRTVYFRRGFIDAVEATTAEVMTEVDTPCPHCGDRPADWETNVVECRRCESTGVISTEWHPTPWASALVQELPLLTRVVLTDRKPYPKGKGLVWYNADRPDPNIDVPEEAGVPGRVWEELEGKIGATWRWKWWETAAEANDALATTVCRWVRKAVTT